MRLRIGIAGLLLIGMGELLGVSVISDRCARATAGIGTPGSDLRVALLGVPDETRVGGTVAYSVVVSNRGNRRAKRALLAVTGSDARVTSVSSKRLSCSHRGEFSIRCSAVALKPRSEALVEIESSAIALGKIQVTATASSATREAKPRDNTASVRTPVLAPDSVQAEGRREFGGTGGLPEEFTIDAISAPHGQDPAGAFSLNTQLPDGSLEELSGHVSCLHVSGQSATVGVVIDRPAGTANGFLFFLTDKGSPGAGRDTFILAGGVAPTARECVLPSPAPGYPILDGDIIIVDTP